MNHSFFDLPALWSEIAASARASSFPPSASSSICLSHASESNFSYQARNFLSCSCGNCVIAFSMSSTVFAIFYDSCFCIALTPVYCRQWRLKPRLGFTFSCPCLCPPTWNTWILPLLWPLPWPCRSAGGPVCWAVRRRGSRQSGIQHESGCRPVSGPGGSD